MACQQIPLGKMVGDRLMTYHFNNHMIGSQMFSSNKIVAVTLLFTNVKGTMLKHQSNWKFVSNLVAGEEKQ